MNNNIKYLIETLGFNIEDYTSDGSEVLQPENIDSYINTSWQYASDLYEEILSKLEMIRNKLNEKLSIDDPYYLQKVQNDPNYINIKNDIYKLYVPSILLKHVSMMEIDSSERAIQLDFSASDAKDLKQKRNKCFQNFFKFLEIAKNKDKKTMDVVNFCIEWCTDKNAYRYILNSQINTFIETLKNSDFFLNNISRYTTYFIGQNDIHVYITINKENFKQEIKYLLNVLDMYINSMDTEFEDYLYSLGEQIYHPFLDSVNN